jgi:TPR repeat protein
MRKILATALKGGGLLVTTATGGGLVLTAANRGGLLLALIVIVQVGCASVLSGPAATRTETPVTQGPPEQVAPSGEASRGEAQARVYLELGQSLIARGEMAAAVARLRQALEWEPDLVQARTSLGLALYGMGDLDGAIEELRGALRRRPDLSQARLTLAAVLMARQDWVGARIELEEALRLEPDLPQAHYSLGVVRHALGDLNGAIEAYRRVLATDPRHHDARYNLALTLKLAGRDAEAAGELLAAAQAGMPRAQYFLGTAYVAGLGVERNLALAITWWFRAAEQGVTQAEDALAQLRQTTLGRGQYGAAERHIVERAFQEFRAELWSEYPDLTRDGDDTVGAALLRRRRVAESVPVLIREASALSEPAHRLLGLLYEQGVDGQLAAHDERILSYFRAAATEGEPRARIELARIYARGLGVPKDLARAFSLLKATPHEDAQRLLRELSAATERGPSSSSTTTHPAPGRP